MNGKDSLSGAGNVELICLFWTTSGVFPGDGEISRFDFKDRVEAAARAGFKGVGLWHTDLEQVMQRYSLKDMKRMLDDNGMRYLELEFLTDWFLGGQRKAEADRRKRLLLEASAALQATHIKIGDFDKNVCSMSRLVEAFAALCREAAEYGATIGFELMSCAMIDHLKDALAMVAGAGASNGGVILDIVQVESLHIPLKDICRIPRQYLVGVELNDGALSGSPLYDPTRERRYCGEGDFDVRGLIRSARQAGFKGPWSVEVMSKELAVLPLEEQARRAFETTMAEFSE